LAGLAALTLMLAPQLAAAAPGKADTFPAGVRACLQATIPTGIDEAPLKAAGWEAYDIDGDGSPLRIYGRGRGPILMSGTGAAAKESGCHVLASRGSTESFAATVDGITKELGAQPTESDPEATLWIVGDKGVMLAGEEDTKRTGVRATIVYIAEGMK
jgi:hypothetical protein